jgi:hypothetical protein
LVNHHPFLAAAGWAVILSAAACESTEVVGTWPCGQSPWVEIDATPGAADAVAVPWSTGFERGFCDYAPSQGFCYTTGYGAYRIVTSPVHSGKYAAAFTVSSDETRLGTNARCVRQGAFPASAYYGAWYYIPEARDNTGTWNLFHFQGGPGPGQDLHGLWDLSLVNYPGGLRLGVFSALRDEWPPMTELPPIPIGSWFHLEIYLKRAADETGEVTVYQDGVVGMHLASIITDDSQWDQWYVGNLVDAIQPPESTVYVDDVTISETP